MRKLLTAASWAVMRTADLLLVLAIRLLMAAYRFP